MIRVEGYEYDVTADFFRAQVVRVGETDGLPGVNRISLEVPITPELRKLVEATLKSLDEWLLKRGSD
jgi:hypothetical protein